MFEFHARHVIILGVKHGLIRDYVSIVTHGSSKLGQLLLVTPHCSCLSDETVKAVGPFYLVYARGSKRSHTGGKCVTCRGLHNSDINHSCVSPRMGCLEYKNYQKCLHSVKLS